MTPRILCLSLTVGLVAATLAQTADKKPDKNKKADSSADLTDPLEIMKKADAATKKVKSVKYKASSSGSGAVAVRVPKLHGTVIMAGKDSTGFAKYRVEFKGERPDGGKIEGVIGSDADEFFLLDPASKTAYVDIDPSVMGGVGRTARDFLMFREFSHPDPFGDEVKGDKRELKGVKNIGKEACYHVHVVYSGGQGEAEWYISKKDFLPRRVDRLQRGQGAFSVTISELTVDPKIGKGTFKVKVPEGWKKTDEPAP